MDAAILIFEQEQGKTMKRDGIRASGVGVFRVSGAWLLALAEALSRTGTKKSLQVHSSAECGSWLDH